MILRTLVCWLRALPVLGLACSTTTPSATVTDASANGAGDGMAPDASVEGSAGPHDDSPQLLEQLAGKRVLWVGAHPDDESTVAPLLAEACGERGAQCSFLVATRGEAGSCALAMGCPPDLGTFRAAEMHAVAALYPAQLVQWDLPDSAATSPDAVAQTWASLKGGQEALVGTFRAAIEMAKADVVLSFDPRHGTTCHQDHRAVSALVVLALRSMGSSAPPGWLAQVRFHITESSPRSLGYVPAAPNDTAMRVYNAERILPSRGQSGWAFLERTLEQHASQFDSEKRRAFAAAPAAERRVFVVPLAEALESDPRYNLCD